MGGWNQGEGPSLLWFRFLLWQSCSLPVFYILICYLIFSPFVLQYAPVPWASSWQSTAGCLTNLDWTLCRLGESLIQREVDFIISLDHNFLGVDWGVVLLDPLICSGCENIDALWVFRVESIGGGNVRHVHHISTDPMLPTSDCGCVPGVVGVSLLNLWDQRFLSEWILLPWRTIC